MDSSSAELTDIDLMLGDVFGNYNLETAFCEEVSGEGEQQQIPPLIATLSNIIPIDFEFLLRAPLDVNYRSNYLSSRNSEPPAATGINPSVLSCEVQSRSNRTSRPVTTQEPFSGCGQSMENISTSEASEILVELDDTCDEPSTACDKVYAPEPIARPSESQRESPLVVGIGESDKDCVRKYSTSACHS